MKNVCNIRSEQFLSRKVWFLTKRSNVKDKVREPVTVKWLFKSKEEAAGLINLKSANVVKGYTQVPGFYFTGLFSPVTS